METKEKVYQPAKMKSIFYEINPIFAVPYPLAFPGCKTAFWQGSCSQLLWRWQSGYGFHLYGMNFHDDIKPAQRQMFKWPRGNTPRSFFFLLSEIKITECAPQYFFHSLYYTQERTLPSAILLLWARVSSYFFWSLLLFILCKTDDKYKWGKDAYFSPHGNGSLSVKKYLW